MLSLNDERQRSLSCHQRVVTPSGRHVLLSLKFSFFIKNTMAKIGKGEFWFKKTLWLVVLPLCISI